VYSCVTWSSSSPFRRIVCHNPCTSYCVRDWRMQMPCIVESVMKKICSWKHVFNLAHDKYSVLKTFYSCSLAFSKVTSPCTHSNMTRSEKTHSAYFSYLCSSHITLFLLQTFCLVTFPFKSLFKLFCQVTLHFCTQF